MNHPFVRSQADALARRVFTSSANGSASGSLPNFTARLSRAYELLFNRTPTGDEVAIAADFLHDSKAIPEKAAWADLIQVLLSSNEFCYVD